jgi:hypothetical protein
MKEVKNADTESVDTDLDNPQKTYVTDRRGTTDDAEMLADITYQQGMYETYQEEIEDKAHPTHAVPYESGGGWKVPRSRGSHREGQTDHTPEED